MNARVSEAPGGRHDRRDQEGPNAPLPAPATVGSAEVSRALAHARRFDRENRGHGVFSPRFNTVVAMRSRRRQIVRSAVEARDESEARARHLRCFDDRGTEREVQPAAAPELVVLRGTPDVPRSAIEGPGSDLFRFAPIHTPLDRALDQDDDRDDLLTYGGGLQRAAGLEAR